jgi:hypothetical protein
VLANSTRTQFGSQDKGKSPRKAAPGRVCRWDGCVTVLSIYNKSDDCSVHELRILKVHRDRP